MVARIGGAGDLYLGTGRAGGHRPPDSRPQTNCYTKVAGVAAVLDRYFSLTDSAQSSGDDIEARVSRIEAQLAQSNGDAEVSSVA
jgi:hypothetical protein